MRIDRLAFNPQAGRHRALILAYHFPPMGGGGVQRTSKYVKYLPTTGIDPIVVTATARSFPLDDVRLARDIPVGTPVWRGRVVPLNQAFWVLDGLLRRLGLPRDRLHMTLWPDEFVGWLPAAVVQGLRAVKAHAPDVLYTTSLPATAHLAGMVIHEVTGLPWIADFRDSYTLNPLYPRTRETLAGQASIALEEAIVARAAYVTFADESMHAHGLDAADPKRVVITNGVDEDDLAHMVSSPRERRVFRLSYVGSFYGRHDGRPVFSAIRALLNRGAIDPAAFELRIVGHVSAESREHLEGLPVTLTGYVDHETALAEMAAASVLLFSRPVGDPVLSGKIIEYLSSGRPVLCVADPTSLAFRLVEEMGAGSCVSVSDEAGISRAIEGFLRSGEEGVHPLDSAVRERVLERFSRRRLAEQLAELLHAAAYAHEEKRCGA